PRAGRAGGGDHPGRGGPARRRSDRSRDAWPQRAEPARDGQRRDGARGALESSPPPRLGGRRQELGKTVGAEGGGRGALGSERRQRGPPDAGQAYRCPNLGSSASRSAFPTTLTTSTVTKIASPGAMTRVTDR